jgi:hypothetical protein
MEVLVFKTNIQDRNQVKKLSPLLKKIRGILRWNVDLQDCDKVLRVETEGARPGSIEEVLQNAGYYCTELED